MGVGVGQEEGEGGGGGGALVELTYEGKTPISTWDRLLPAFPPTVAENLGHTSLRALPLSLANKAAISSYITITNTHIYSIGGPTGEVHAKPCSSSSASSSAAAAAAAAAGTTGFGEKVQEVLFVPEDELEGWDKTNKALVSACVVVGGGVWAGSKALGYWMVMNETGADVLFSFLLLLSFFDVT